MKEQLQLVLVSACLAGELVRYNGKRLQYSHPILTRWLAEGRVRLICPEVAGGLPTPRQPAEIEPGADGNALLTGQAKIYDCTGKNVTEAYVAGAKNAVEVVAAAGIRIAVLKEGSPSCGSGLIADGHFSGVRTAGQGVTAAALRAAAVHVFNEHQLEAADGCLMRLERDNHSMQETS